MSQETRQWHGGETDFPVDGQSRSSHCKVKANEVREFCDHFIACCLGLQEQSCLV